MTTPKTRDVAQSGQGFCSQFYMEAQKVGGTKLFQGKWLWQTTGVKSPVFFTWMNVLCMKDRGARCTFNRDVVFLYFRYGLITQAAFTSSGPSISAS